jgi:cell division septum initiation protein DivIVA
VDVTELIAQLRSAVERARSMPMSSSAVINRGHVLALIEQLEATVQTAVAAAEQVYAERDAILDKAQGDAARLLSQAQAERERLTCDSEVFRVAKSESERLLAHAAADSEALRRETDAYVDTKLAYFEVALTKTLSAVGRGRERLRDRSELDQESLDAAAASNERGAASTPG